MADIKENICRLCLNFEDNNFSSIGATDIEKLKTIFPETALCFPNKSVACSKCRATLEKCIEFQRTLSLNMTNNDKIQSQKRKSNDKTINLHTIVDPKSPQSNQTICRICFKTNQDAYEYITSQNSGLNTILKSCIPGLDLNVTPKPAVCAQCHNTLCEMNNFKNDCLSVEEKIQTYCDSASSDDIDLNKVLMMMKVDDENDFLSAFEIKDEEEGDIFDAIPISNEESHKRALSVSIDEEEQNKRTKLEINEIIDVELPPFQFNLNMLEFPNATDVTLEDWLTMVDEYKQKYGWSDYTTIHKVLVQLKAIQELYVWFSNIADIMNWEQWQRKLLRAFPPKNDYHLTLKRMMLRKKRKNETYVGYYADKLERLEPFNLTQEQKVSCIFGGISDLLVCCIGRVGNFKNPGDLLDYFKSCDDKEKIEKAAGGTKETKITKDSNGRQTPIAKPKPEVEPELEAEPKPQPQVTPSKPNLNNTEDKYTNKYTTKCIDCGRYGHTEAECREYHIGEHMDRVDKIKTQNNPNPSKALACHVKVCTRCRQRGHSSNHCPRNLIQRRPIHPQPTIMPSQPSKRQIRSAKRRAPSSNKDSQVSNKPKEEKCTSCHQVGHTVVNCFKEWSKKIESHKNSNPRPKPKHKKKESNQSKSDWTRCGVCGKFGSKATPCCSARRGASEIWEGGMSQNGSYIGSYLAQNELNKQICLRCYQTGHTTDQCYDVSRGLYYR